MSNIIQSGNGSNKNSRFEYVDTYSVNRNMNSSATETLDPKKIINILFRHKWLILLLLLAGASAGWFIAGTITPTYQSSGTILINTGGGADEELSNIISQATGVRTGSTLANELQVLQSREFARLVAQDIIEENPGNADEFPVLWNIDEEGVVSRASEAAVTNRIRRGLSALVPEEDSEVVELSFSSSSPQETALVVNTAMNIYVERSTLQNRRAAESTAQFLENEMERVEESLERSEARLREYMDRTGIVMVDEQASGIVNEQVALETELQQLNVEIQTVNQAISNLERQLDRIQPGLSEQFTEAIGPRIRNSQEQLALYESERTLIISRNPGVLNRDPLPDRMIFLDEQIARLKSEIRELSAQLFTEDDEFMGLDSADRAELVSSIQSDLVELRIERNQYESRRDALAERREEIDSRFDSLPDGMIELSRLQRDVRINEELYLNVSRQYADMSVLKQSQFGFGQILDTALVPGSPVSPNKILMAIIGLMMGGVVATGLLLIRDFMDNSVNSMDMVKQLPISLLSAVPVLDKVPEKKKKEFKTKQSKIPNELVLMRDKGHVVSESVRRLKNNLIYQYGHVPPKTIAITSAEKGDGKTTVAANLGIAFADEGYKTLVIDTDFRRSNLHSYFGLDNEEGITEYLNGKTPLVKLFKSTDNSHLKVVTAGKNNPSPESVVNNREFRAFMDKMKELFDVIICDTPPFGIISDSTALLKTVESTIVVTRFRKTNRGVLLKTLEELERIDAQVGGIVLNAFNHKYEAGTHYGSGYYKSVYSNYEAYIED
ncbi:hypothetical protein DDZ15_02115 [Rhodohalobacter mucosus]|uniref:Capsular exopolysaccharide family n=2 Tax=Rhodohalobacter mucosus TaxID=2079485 RepID=A0A316TV99_9BACT|nr:hypothetical protein DDZ15_02115 [Rhodohalobacter mucosus]